MAWLSQWIFVSMHYWVKWKRKPSRVLFPVYGFKFLLLKKAYSRILLKRELITKIIYL